MDVKDVLVELNDITAMLRSDKSSLQDSIDRLGSLSQTLQSAGWCFDPSALCQSCNQKVSAVEAVCIDNLQRYNRCCVLANNVISVVASNSKMLKLARGSAVYMDIQNDIDIVRMAVMATRN